MFKSKNKSNAKIPNFTLQIYDFVYDILMKFPLCDFIFETITNKNLSEDVYRLINFKVHIYHLHVTSKIYDYAQNFRENQTGFSCIAHNYLNFDYYFTLKGYRVSCWG